MAKQPETIDAGTLPTSNITPELELKISKQDIIDTLVDEQEEKLDDEINKLTRDGALLQAEGVKLLRQGSQRIREEAKTTPEVAAAKTQLLGILGADAKVTETLTHISNVDRNFVEKKSLALPQLPGPDMYGKTKLKKEVNAVLDGHENVALINGNDCFSLKVSSRGEGQSGEMCRWWPVGEKFLDSDEVKQAREIDTKLQALLDRLEDLKEAKGKLRSMGQRAKSKLVKDLLGQTEQGKGILKSMNSGSTTKQITKLLAKNE